MRRRLFTLVLSVATLLAGATAGTATGTPTTAGTTDEDLVRITIKVAGCGSCELGLVHYDDSDPDSYWSAPLQKVEQGKVVFEVPVENTWGMSISIDAPWATAYIHGVQFVAVRYGGFEPGDKVSKRQALRARKGSRCWSGTDTDRTLKVRVVRKTYGSAPEVALRAWANPTLPSTDLVDIHEGGIVTTHPHCPAP